MFFNKSYGNKSSEEFLKSLADNFDQKSDAESDTDLNFNNSKPF